MEDFIKMQMDIEITKATKQVKIADLLKEINCDCKLTDIGAVIINLNEICELSVALASFVTNDNYSEFLIIEMKDKTRGVKFCEAMRKLGGKYKVLTNGMHDPVTFESYEDTRKAIETIVAISKKF